MKWWHYSFDSEFLSVFVELLQTLIQKLIRSVSLTPPPRLKYDL